MAAFVGAEDAGAGATVACGGEAAPDACPEQAIVKLGKGRKYSVNLDLCTGCAVCFDQCPCHAIEMIPQSQSANGPLGSLGEVVAPHRFKLRP